MEFKVRDVDHARDRDNSVILIGSQVFYEEDITSQRVERIVQNYGGYVLILKNGLRTIAHCCWVDKR